MFAHYHMATIATMAFLSVGRKALSEVVTGNKWTEKQITTIPRIGKVKHNRPETGNSKYRKK